MTRETLAAADQFHHGGAAATVELANLAGLRPGMRVLDLGSGLGGPARTLAAEFGCAVTGIDLVPDFVAAATMLTELTGMSDRVSFQQGSALELPFADGAFDVVWTQNVMMNIAAKDQLFREVRRVLKPGGRFAFQDILQGEGELLLPVPWATEPSHSHLVRAEEERNLLKAAGFREVSWLDTTGRLADARLVPAAPGQAPAAPPPFGLHLVMGSSAPVKGANLLANAREGRILSVLGVFDRG
ncbi:MAG: class I SAM-dependent methyltransferase [Chloroflexi bacterium]|nr:class I SAM-dependent methyltransferase [Chloroflexota bacterium]